MASERKKTAYRDLALVAFFLLLAAGLSAALLLGRPAGAAVVVRVDGREIARYSLAREGVYPLNGGSNILVIENGEAYLSQADCPDKLCVRQGKISRSGQVITCLPNRVTVTVVGAEDGVDVVVG